MTQEQKEKFADDYVWHCHCENTRWVESYSPNELREAILDTLNARDEEVERLETELLQLRVELAKVKGGEV